MALFGSEAIVGASSYTKAVGIRHFLIAVVLLAVCGWMSNIGLASAGELIATPSKALQKVTRAAMRGNRVAIRNAAKAVLELGPTQFPYAETLRPLFRREALKGSSSAANAYGMMLQFGIGGSAAPREAPSWYARGGDRGNVSASKNAAMVYALGWGVKRDPARALQLLRKVPKEQRARKMYQISAALLQPGREEPNVALFWLEQIMRLNTAVTLRAVGLYERITGVESGCTASVCKALTNLAATGNDDAAVELGKRLSFSSEEGDRIQAAQNFLLAAESGNAHGFEGLDALFAADASRAGSTLSVTTIEFAANQGSKAAMAALGKFYSFQAEPESQKKGLVYLTQAANFGNADAQYRLAMMLLGSSSENRKSSLALAYMVLAAEGGNQLAGVAIHELGSIPVAEAKKIIAASSQ